MALATLAGQTLVTAAVTDAWESFRAKVARLFGRGEPDPQVGSRLDATHEQLSAAGPDGLADAQAEHASRWRTRFADLLADDPEAEAGLRSLVEEMREKLPGGTVTNTISGGTQHGPVFMGRDFTGITVSAPPPAQKSS